MTAPPFLIDSGVQATAGTTGPIQVLYVDDSPFDRALVRDALERESEGFRLTEASTREEFEGILARKEAFDLVLSDFNILGMTGLEVLARIRGIPERAHLPVVILTAKGQDADREEAVRLGAADFITKPFSPKKFLNRVDEILAQRCPGCEGADPPPRGHPFRWDRDPVLARFHASAAQAAPPPGFRPAPGGGHPGAGPGPDPGIQDPLPGRRAHGDSPPRRAPHPPR